MFFPLRPTAVIQLFLAAVLLASCTVSPLGRRQLVLHSDQAMDQVGEAAFVRLKDQTPLSRDPRAQAFVRCVAEAILLESEPRTGKRDWEIVVFEDKSANAFALPGGKIGVYSGMLDIAYNQDRLAAVIAHEIAHVHARHANERLSTAQTTEIALQAVEELGDLSRGSGRRTMAMLGLGAQVGVLLPFSRAQEREADLMGLDLMAGAGFDPRAALRLWRKMSESREGAPPEFLSTHPSYGARMDAISDRMPRAKQIFEAARRAGLHPDCKR